MEAFRFKSKKSESDSDDADVFITYESANILSANATKENVPDFFEVESAMNSILKNFWITSDGVKEDVISFLDGIRDQLIKKISEQVTLNNAIKFNLVLICKFRRGESEEYDASFKTMSRRVLIADQVNEIVDEIISELLKEKSESQTEESGWSFSEIIGMQLRVNKYTPLRGSTYIDLPSKIGNKKAVVNVKNNDNYCFKYSVWAKNIKRSPQRVTKYLTKACDNAYRWDCITYPVAIKDIAKFERANNISINVFGLDETDNVYPIKIVDYELADHRDLLYLTNDKTSHYCWLKDFGRLVRSQLTKHNNQAYICKSCFTYFREAAKLEEHKEVCRGMGEPSKIVLPDETNNTLKFTDIHYSFKVPYVIYADFECLSQNVSSCEPSSYNHTKHDPFSFCYVVITPDGCEKPQLYRGPDVIEVFIKRIKKEAERISMHYRKIVPIRTLNAKEERHFKNATTCHICGKKLKKYRVKDHDHLDGSYRGPAHNSCNLVYRMPKVLPVFIHNLPSYDGHLVVRELNYDDEKISAIPNDEGKFISFGKTIGNYFGFRFVDTCGFINSSLELLASKMSEFKYTREIFGEKANLLTQKVIFPYGYTKTIDQLEENSLPQKRKFLKGQTDDDVSDAEYIHARKVWNEFECRNLGEYSDVHLQRDVMLLADAFESFRTLCFGEYKQDPAWYHTARRLTFDAMLKHTEIELELMTDYDMILMIEKGIRGGISQCSKRYCEANNKYMECYIPEKKSNYIAYFGAKNLYCWALSQPLPYANFRWLDRDEINALEIENVSDEGKKGYILEVDLEIPRCLHDEHLNFPLCPEYKIPPGGKHPKLLTTLENKEKYTIHYVNLKQAISLGLRLKKIHRVIEFDQAPWLKSYIDLNTTRTKLAKNEFEKDFYKVMNNAVFGRIMENARKGMDLEIVDNEKRLGKLISQPKFLDRTIFKESLVAVHVRKCAIEMNKPIYLGFCVLDLSKVLMYDFHYRSMLPKYGNKLSLAYIDTDSFIYSIETDDIYEDMQENIDYFVTSYHQKVHISSSDKNSEAIGKFRDICKGQIITHFIGLRSKLYSLKIADDKVDKGITKAVRGRSLNFDDYIRVVNGKSTEYRKMDSSLSMNHDLYSLRVNNVKLSAFDDKMSVCGLNTIAWGYYRRSGKRKWDEAFNET